MWLVPVRVSSSIEDPVLHSSGRKQKVSPHERLIDKLVGGLFSLDRFLSLVPVLASDLI